MSEFEIIWVLLRPRQFPRPLSCLLFAVVYCSPSYDAATKNKLSSCISCDELLRKYPFAGVFIVGDFHTLQTNKGKPTNCSSLYTSPVILSPVGKSDHNCVLVTPRSHSECETARKRVVTRQRLTPAVLDSVTTAVNNIRKNNQRLFGVSNYMGHLKLKKLWCHQQT